MGARWRTEGAIAGGQSGAATWGLLGCQGRRAGAADAAVAPCPTGPPCTPCHGSQAHQLATAAMSSFTASMACAMLFPMKFLLGWVGGWGHLATLQLATTSTGVSTPVPYNGCRKTGFQCQARRQQPGNAYPVWSTSPVAGSTSGLSLTELASRSTTSAAAASPSATGPSTCGTQRSE